MRWMLLALAVWGSHSAWASGSSAPSRPAFEKVLMERSAQEPAPVLDLSSHTWAEAARNAAADNALGVDIQTLAELNATANEVWQQWVDCNGGDINQVRLSYLQDAPYCSVKKDQSQALRQSLHQLHLSVHSFLATSWLAGRDLDENYHLPKELGLFNPLIIQFLIEEIAAQPVFIEDMGHSKINEVVMLKDRRGNDVMIGNWPLRNALELLSLVPNTDRGSWSLFPALPANVLNSLAVSPVLDDLSPSHNGSYRTGVGDIRELVSFNVAKKIFARLGEVSWGDDIFEQPQAILNFLRARQAL